MVSIQLGTLLLAGATLFGALVGSLTQFVLTRRENRRKRHNLRLALLSELDCFDWLENINDYNFGTIETVSQSMEPNVYTSSADEIGQLSEEEVRVLVWFYSRLSFLDGWLSGIWDDFEVVENADPNEVDMDLDELTELHKGQLEDFIEELKQKRRDAIRILSSNLER